MSAASQAVLLVSHGTVEDLADLEAFVTNIRRGHPPPPELLAELRRRYDAIGGGSPLVRTSRSLAGKLEARLGVPVRLASRLWHPYPRDVLAELGVERVVVVALAQFSAHVYRDAVLEATAALRAAGGPEVQVASAGNWGGRDDLADAFAKRVRAAAAALSPEERDGATLVLSAHSLPRAVVEAGDPYEREVRAAADAVARRVADVLPDAVVCFQSQGMTSGPGGRPAPWLGPTLAETFDALAARGRTHALVAPIGFLADHVEILYDLDVEARAMARARKLGFSRSASLDDDDDLVAVLAAIAAPLLAEDGR